MRKYTKAFTLSEMLVALGVIAVLCAIVLPFVHRILPNKNIVMAKRAYYTVQTMVSELINDEYCYPDKSRVVDEADRREGFLDGEGYVSCPKWGTSKGDNKTLKFVTLFFDKIGLVEANVSGGNVLTDDGIRWSYKTSQFSGSNAESSYFDLVIDVNGNDAPNCGDSTGTCSASSIKNYDQFTLRIYADGKVDILDDWAAEAVDITSGVK